MEYTKEQLELALKLYYEARFKNPDNFMNDEEMESLTPEELAKLTLESLLSYLNN
jgi:hypothetical protein